ncbi:PLP-dependent transferase [Bradyrhizobium arachidis]|nr:PLP-dependent transferase [Bradyrhizobium arachidis]
MPIYRGSTIVSESALEAAVCKLEGGFRSILFPSGQFACTHSVLACLKAGDAVLISDGVYSP